MTTDADAARNRVAAAALALVEDGMTVGLGTGDTARRFVEALGRRVREEGLRVRCAVTSNATAALARAASLDVRPLPELESVDVAFDGADEVDPRLDLVKGGGGAHTREKIVAASAARFVVLVDESKLVDRLGAFPVAVEVVPEAVALVTRRLVSLGASPRLRYAPGEPGTPWITDLGHRLLDAQFSPIADAASLAAALDAIPGVIEHGLFVGMASLVLVGEFRSSAVRSLTRTL
jgi:ribose 5-phosphate isomerase A